jgi:hypothetical protein
LQASGLFSFVCQSRAFATDCGSFAGKTFGAATMTEATSLSPPSSLLGVDQYGVLPDAGRD